MKRNIINIHIFFILLIFISCKIQKTNEDQINNMSTEGIYISRDTLFAIDKHYKNEISVRLIKLNKNFSVQVSLLKYSYKEGEDILNNANVTTWLNNEALYNYSTKNRNKIFIECYMKMPKRAWNDFATASSTKISAKFKISGDKIIQIKESNKYFAKTYILDRTITNNHKSIKIGNGCN